MSKNTAEPGIDFNDRLTIHCPMLHTIKRWPNDLVPVDGKSRQSLKAFLDRFGKYIFRENHYDFPLGAPDGDRWKGYLFLGNYMSGSTRQPVGAVVFEYVTGCKDLSDRWWLMWAWIHPYARQQGLLTKHWPAFCQEFGNFLPHGPFSKGMESFLRKQGKCIVCWNPAVSLDSALACDACSAERKVR